MSAKRASLNTGYLKREHHPPKGSVKDPKVIEVKNSLDNSEEFIRKQEAHFAGKRQL